MAQLKILVDTFLKQQPIQSSKLLDNQKQFIKNGTILEIQSFLPSSDHIKVTLSGAGFQGKNTWYIYQRCVTILSNNQVIFPAATKLAVPYYDQLDNSDDPYGTCNVTSIAMTLSYLRAARKHPEKGFPDELNEYCSAHGLDRHEPLDLVKVVEAYGCKDTFKQKTSFQEVKEWLIQGNPIVVHGYFTQSGHIVCFIGYNSQGFIVNDPYGEIMYTPYHRYYDTYASGAGLTYSYNMITALCCGDGEFWVHFITR